MKTFSSHLQNLPAFVLRIIVGIIAFIIFIYYPLGMFIVHKVDDSATFAAGNFEVKNGSASTAIAIALLDREINGHHWTPSDPFFYPGAALTRMPAFQRGVITGLSRFAVSLSDQIARTRGSSQIDPDLQNAVGLLKYSPNVWMFNPDVSWLPTASSAKQYQSAIKSLAAYNERLAGGKATFERRADNLMQTLDGMASDLGSASSALETHIETRSSLAFGASADLYYYNKGLLYANYLLLREMEKDFADVIKEKQLQNAWAQMISTLNQGMSLGNFLVINAAPDSQFFPNHLASQGFFILRVRTQLREVTNILLK
ncbi:MAG: DUF2333 family protein [Alphaproteobacteria bacterium]|nr:DUF2333 family protein [Alphaproteobacteria bacterium]